ncbi:DUF2194 domain-containing protein [uncultured Selenomonas sp.]|uniref:DUF2194 domain-containing protein n=1 Tax=uncultured Selenomonas sp. TaxID=159275 RepID=UPI0028D18C09|nr:DUF2194 domain-containing protein [uncultured Selenomonas sp.]
MNKRSLCVLLLIAFALGVFFQYSRFDGFLHLGAVQSRPLGERVLRTAPPEEALPREMFLIIYDPSDVLSMYARHNMEKILAEKRKGYESRPLYDARPLDGAYQGIVLATGRLGAVRQMPAVLDYVRAGGTLLALQKPEQSGEAPLPAALLECLGIAQLGPLADVRGLHILTDFMLGGRDFRFHGDTAFTTQVNESLLIPAAEVQIESLEGVPLLWRTPLGAGQVYVYNGVERDDKTNLGVYTAMMAHCGQDTVYPVVGAKIFVLDDFPAPVPEGDFARIYDELGVDTETFYRKIWWPFIRQMGADEDIRYTGAIIETYGAQVKGPFRSLGGRAARDGLIIYGRELLNMGGELGLHGYNHQPLAPEGYGQPRLNYVPWESQEDMEEALRELRNYVKSVYPDYEFRFYVPPSNIMSPEGKAAIRKVFPEVIAFGSLFDGPANERAYYQNFERKDGVFELPRISSGHQDHDGLMFWQEISALNYIGVFSHFIHPDELFYEESAHTSWAQMEAGMRSFMQETHRRYPWLRAATVSESLPVFSDYFDMDCRIVRAADHMTLYTWGCAGELRFILRTAREIARTEGCTAEPADQGAYLIRIDAPEAHIYWKGAP